MKLLFTLFLFSTIFLSCNQPTKTSKPKGTIAALNIPADSSSALDTSAKASIDLKIFEGLLFSSAAQNQLRDCSSNSSYILIDENSLVSSAYQKAIGNLTYENESVYARVKGYLKTGDTLMISGIEDVKPKSFLTPCFDYEFVLLGTEPFWSVEIIPDQNMITLKDVSIEKAYVLPYSKPLVKGNTYSYVSKNEKGDILEIFIRKENCNDGMSDRNYHYSSQITFNGKSMSGCAIKKGDKL